MADATYDAVIIGAGHNGLALGTYLARAGFEVGIFEKRAEEGGGLCTEELTRPGFLHNVHCNYHTLVGVCPVYEHLGLEEHGLRYVRPPVQMASVFRDGTALTIHTDLDRTCASLARFSRKDADTFRRLYEETKGYLDMILLTLMYSPPISMKDITKALVAWGVEEKAEFLSVHLRRLSIDQFLDQHFENAKVKAHLAFHAACAGYSTDRKGLAVSFPLLAGKIDNWHLCLGGSHRLAHALWRDLAQHGGVMWSDAEVTSVIVDGNRAVGVRTADGIELKARKLVASTVSVEQTFLEFIEPSALSEEFTQDVKSKVAHKDWSLFSVHLAMNAFPDYIASEFDPDVNRAWVVNLGVDSPQRLNDDWVKIRKGQLVDPQPNAAVNSLYDPTDAPPGFSTGLLRQFAPFALADGGEGAWDDLGRWYGRKCIDAWRRYAPNLTDDTILDWSVFTPHDIARKLPNMVKGDWMMGEISLANMLDQRPLPELGQYRTPVEGLYMAGSTQHPHGFITFGPGYNALQVIADDLGIDKWWQQI